MSINEVGGASDIHKEEASVSNMDTPTNNPSSHLVPTLSSEVLHEHQKQLEALQEQVLYLYSVLVEALFCIANRSSYC